jgi:N6-adenosine-specific RNA methylase IME4
MTAIWPTGQWDVIAADPPWDHYGSPTKWAAAGKEYPLIRDEDMMKLPVPDLMHRESVLFLWATGPRLDFALDCLHAWHLWYRGVAFVWVKTKQNGAPIGAQGVRPSIVKPTTEFVLAASKTKRGRPMPVADESVRQVVMAPKREHSRKPDEVQERIELLYPHATRLELFARRPRPGWDAFGNELDNG